MSFRLTLLYALLFSASAVILFAVIYWATAVYMTSELDAAIDSDLVELETAMRVGGAAALAAATRIGCGRCRKARCSISCRIRAEPCWPVICRDCPGTTAGAMS